MAMSNPGGSRGIGSSGHSARRYCSVAGHYSRSPQPAALTESSAFGIRQDPSESRLPPSRAMIWSKYPRLGRGRVCFRYLR